VTPGVSFLALRSDGLDKYAQADGRFIGKPGTPTGITAEGPALKGATNIVIGAVDHREPAYHPRAFREIYKFIAGREPDRVAIVPEAEVTLGGLVTGTPGGVQTNRPVTGASVEIYRVSPDTGERIGGAIHTSQTGAVPADAGAGSVVLMSRPRGYFGLPRDVVLLDGKEPADVKPGVPTDSLTTLRLSAAEVGRPVVALFNQERIVARAWPASENRIAVAELTY